MNYKIVGGSIGKNKKKSRSTKTNSTPSMGKRRGRNMKTSSESSGKSSRSKRSKHSSRNKYSKKTNGIPKIIWTFWESPDGKIPELVKKCIDSWKLFNVDYKIEILNIKRMKELFNVDLTKFRHIKDGKKRLWTRISDYSRTIALYKKGGIWLDATNICTESFDKWLDNDIKINNPDYIGYYLNEWTSNRKFPVIENWFFAVPKNSHFMKLWYNEFMGTQKWKNLDDYIINARDNLGVDLQGIGEGDMAYLNYLAMHISCQIVLQTKNYDRKKMVLMNAEAKGNPYYYLARYNFNTANALRNVAKNKDLWSYPIIKLRGTERDYIIKHPKVIELFEKSHLF